MIDCEFHILIPARLDSSRLPRKALADLGGQPMVVRTLERARDSGASSVTVATDSEEIAAVVEAAGGDSLMTSATHRSGTDRLAEAVERLGLADQAIVVNLQGDEPAMPTACLRQVANLLAGHEHADMATLWQPLASEQQWRDPNVVKLVCDRQRRALYFSRAAIPWPREGGWPVEVACRHVGLYAYRASALRAWRELPFSELEVLESLEQLRALAAGWLILAERACAEIPVGVDTPEHLAAMRARWPS
ncbi:MAG: 3-deoxy-manno-octulosonate cytidylyltransferase [Wenzhouxiangella sp.]|nr:3-deoxy-manno-octulosonate cytidylyltransferase [Wenzhouxiangella sp.]MCH8477821.1 3-deoxy-manno-octulosonate cytidylyltransferase [Wenzhouxiangella sp.]TVR94270.1 MAG: 3-deoxy-manno-octulosonate cytidylyltransferase [Wenzhouxiangellaceae bacterium]